MDWNNQPPEVFPKPESQISIEEMEEIWKRRASHLAQVVVPEEEGEQIQLLILRMGNDLFGIDARCVFDIRLAGSITPVPRTPDWVAGVVTVRGEIFSVIDLRRFFKLPAAPEPGGKKNSLEVSEESYLVGVETPELELALLVDEVLAVESLAASRIKSQPEILGEMRAEYVRGITSYGGSEGKPAGRLLIVLNLPALLADPALVIEEKVI
jgi:purine-binding chemotaxis protein CheW